MSYRFLYRLPQNGWSLLCKLSPSTVPANREISILVSFFLQLTEWQKWKFSVQFFMTKRRVAPPNRMNFRKRSKRPLTPPLIFGKLYCGFRDKSAYVHMEGHLCIIWSYFPWDGYSTNVQHGNRVKTYPKKIFLYHFHAEKALFQGPNFAT